MYSNSYGSETNSNAPPVRPTALSPRPDRQTGVQRNQRKPPSPRLARRPEHPRTFRLHACVESGVAEREADQGISLVEMIELVRLAKRVLLVTSIPRPSR